MAWDETTREEHDRKSERHETDLTDEEWLLVEPPLPAPAKLGRRRTTDLRETSDAIQYMLATGCQWRAIPKCFPPSATVQNHSCAWRDNGVLERMPAALRTLGRAQAGRSPEPTAAAIDSQSVKTTEAGGPAGCDAGKKVKGRKRHLTVDVEGFPIAVRVLRRRTCRTGTGRRPSSWRCREGAAGDEAVGGRRLRGSEARGRAGGARPGVDRRDRPAAQGNKGLHGPVPPLGGGADVCVDVAVPASGEGLRADAGEFAGLGAARGVPVPDAAGGAGPGGWNLLTY